MVLAQFTAATMRLLSMLARKHTSLLNRFLADGAFHCASSSLSVLKRKTQHQSGHLKPLIALATQPTSYEKTVVTLDLEEIDARLHERVVDMALGDLPGVHVVLRQGRVALQFAWILMFSVFSSYRVFSLRLVSFEAEPRLVVDRPQFMSSRLNVSPAHVGRAISGFADIDSEMVYCTASEETIRQEVDGRIVLLDGCTTGVVDKILSLQDAGSLAVICSPLREQSLTEDAKASSVSIAVFLTSEPVCCNASLFPFLLFLCVCVCPFSNFLLCSSQVMNKLRRLYNSKAPVDPALIRRKLHAQDLSSLGFEFEWCMRYVSTAICFDCGDYKFT